MTPSIVVVLAAFAVLVALASKDDNHLFHEHYARANAFRCRTPRPTAVSANDLLPASASGKLYVPQATVLSRCDHGSGCCLNRPGASCVPALEETVWLPFQVTYVVAVGSIARGTIQVEQVPAINHTRCYCRHPSNDDPR
ncbi:uncharacterized protein LOC124354251 [Homalodisca vitripennis]|uniref:uncharacterized protein LOC124354251 n=1 Tax=Homalodisca vitripennis TaxID=197043 RepID=UPI001EEA4BCF|nr:uncharacterized protein LOC124354251 [Homalodisca vitripennis]